MGPFFLLKIEKNIGYSRCKLQNFGILHDFKEILVGNEAYFGPCGYTDNPLCLQGF